MVDRVKNSGDYEEDLILNSNEALDIADDSTIVIVVDVNRVSYTECPELLQNASL